MNELPTTVTKDELKVALLENNEKINKAIEASADKITKAVRERTDPFVQSFTDLAEKVGVQHGQIEELQGKLGNIWAKMIAIGAACAIVGGFLGFLAGQFTR